MENRSITSVYFVRHAESDHTIKDGPARPLTAAGKEDARLVRGFFCGRPVSAAYSSPYLRAIETIRPAAEALGLPVTEDARLRELEKGPGGGTPAMYLKRWRDIDFHEPGGESIRMLRERNLAVVNEILQRHRGQSVMIATHGMALSSILSGFDSGFGIADLLRIVDWMPYIVELQFDGTQFLGKLEHLHVDKQVYKNMIADNSLETETIT